MPEEVIEYIPLKDINLTLDPKDEYMQLLKANCFTSGYLRELVELRLELQNDLPEKLKEVLEKGTWRQFFVHHKFGVVEYKNFIEFIEAEAPWGLGTTYEELKSFCHKRPDVLEMLVAEVEGEGNQFVDWNRDRR